MTNAEELKDTKSKEEEKNKKGIVISLEPSKKDPNNDELAVVKKPKKDNTESKNKPENGEAGIFYDALSKTLGCVGCAIIGGIALASVIFPPLGAAIAIGAGSLYLLKVYKDLPEDSLTKKAIDDKFLKPLNNLRKKLFSPKIAKELNNSPVVTKELTKSPVVTIENTKPKEAISVSPLTAIEIPKVNPLGKTTDSKFITIFNSLDPIQKSWAMYRLSDATKNTIEKDGLNKAWVTLDRFEKKTITSNLIKMFPEIKPSTPPQKPAITTTKALNKSADVSPKLHRSMTV